ncbi:MAG: winged helix DNA-binding domain-containing protein [Acidimicrobiia bacterium]|nr:winged helix DNA-binding domain-containing protein [Acidimicrobiia bacterium]
MQRLSAGHARRIALTAQGFADPRPSGRIDIRHLRRVMDRVAILQLDSVNVLERSHYLPMFARLGPYPRALLDQATHGRRELFEYLFHAASYSTGEVLPLLRPRMEAIQSWARIREVMDEHPGYIEKVYEEVAERGPLTGADLADPGRRTGPWWGMGKGSTALEWLYVKGRLAISHRPASFAKVYDLAERVYPEGALDGPVIDREASVRERTVIAARAHGVATVNDLADYFRMRVREVRPQVERLVASGSLLQVEVQGWGEPAFLHAEARVPRGVRARALLSPFDSLIWDRHRTERLFGFRYRVEIYVPKPKRHYGYYVLPFLLGENLVARVDLKADRQAGALLVQGAHLEPGFAAGNVAGPLASELDLMASWLGLDGVVVRPNGDLASHLARAVDAQ